MEVSPAAMRIFAGLLHDRSGQEIATARSWRVEIVLRPLLKEFGADTFDRLAALVMGARNGPLARAVVDALLNNETYFFRDPPAFQTLLADVLVPMAATRAASRRLRIWSAGCSTGQEVYSIAMLLAADAARWAGWSIELIGSDISGAAIRQAQAGLYNQFEIQRGLPVRDMMRWFEPDDERWRVKADLRARVRFLPGNLLDTPPHTMQADVILCRNVLLYLSAEKRAVAFGRLAGALAGDGCLMLGAGETVLGQTDLFEPDPDRRGLYRRSDAARGALCDTRRPDSAAA